MSSTALGRFPPRFLRGLLGMVALFGSNRVFEALRDFVCVCHKSSEGRAVSGAQGCRWLHVFASV